MAPFKRTWSQDGSVTATDVREALSDLDADDLSNKSPVSPGAREVGTAISDEEVTIQVAGQEGQWSKTSEAAIESAIGSIDGVEDLGERQGGYQADADSGEDDEEDTDSEEESGAESEE